MTYGSYMSVMQTTPNVYLRLSIDLDPTQLVVAFPYQLLVIPF